MTPALARPDLDWKNLGFQYHKTPYRFVAHWRNGAWEDGKLISDEVIALHESATSVHYAQQCFEGMKAQRSKNGDLLLFRPFENATRMRKTAQRLMMPAVSDELFLHGVSEAVRHNADWIPPYGSGGSLYIRPMLIGIGENLGLRTAPEFMFRVFVSPVGPYFKNGLEPISLMVSARDRVAPKGIGMYKAGANYPGSLLASQEARNTGANEAVHLDPKENIYFEEAASANLLFYMQDKRLLTPDSNTILESITRKSLMELAERALGLEATYAKIHARNVLERGEIAEMGICGTAAVLSPVNKIWFEEQEYAIGESNQAGEVMSELYRLLTGVQSGDLPDDFGWRHPI